MRLHHYASLTALATFILLIAGGLVTSTGSGLAVPDWPLSYGSLFPPMVGGIRFEHTHRVIAGIVALMIALLAVWLHRREPRAWVRRLGDVAAGAVLLQALLGGLTVLLVLPAPISIAHACLGQGVFCLVLSIAMVTSPTWEQRGPSRDPALRGLCLTATSLLALQLLLGAVLRHTGLVLAPHIMNGVLAAVAIVAACVRLWRGGKVCPITAAWAALVVVQIGLGLAVMSHRTYEHAILRTSHQALGALILGLSVMVSLRVFRPGVSVPRLAPSGTLVGGAAS